MSSTTAAAEGESLDEALRRIDRNFAALDARHHAVQRRLGAQRRQYRALVSGSNRKRQNLELRLTEQTRRNAIEGLRTTANGLLLTTAGLVAQALSNWP